MQPRRQITFTLDLEDHTAGDDPTRRYISNSRRLLGFLEDQNIRATIFIVGEVISACREVIRSAADSGHEFALHSATHTPLTAQLESELRPQLVDAKRHLEDLCGAPVVGFRAPVFSLVMSTRWVTEMLADLGFRYSSSVLPAPNPLYGFPGAPRSSFMWPSGIIELPAPVVAFAGMQIPPLGGIYLRYMPHFILRRITNQFDDRTLLWSYIHPYDIDPDEGYFRFPGTSAAMSLLLWRRRAQTLEKISTLARGAGLDAGAPLAQRIADMNPLDLPVFRGPASTARPSH